MKREGIFAMFYPLGVIVILGIVIFLISLGILLYKSVTSYKKIEQLERDKLLLNSDVETCKRGNK